jgi:kinesin family protein 5
LNDRAENEHGERTIALEDRLTAVQQDYEDLLTRNLSPEDVEDVKARLEQLYSDRKETQTELVHDLKDQLTHKSQDIEKLEKSIADLQARGVTNGGPNGVVNKGIQQQMAEFDQMKKNLMRDLQNRCERVVELEISLDETREQYNNVLRSSNNRQQQKKMAFLERNLEQLTVVQRQLVDQNTSLKKEVAIAERKLIARNERILSLESLLSDSQDKLTAANHRYVSIAAVSTIDADNRDSQIRTTTCCRQRTSGSRKGVVAKYGGGRTRCDWWLQHTYERWR